MTRTTRELVGGGTTILVACLLSNACGESSGTSPESQASAPPVASTPTQPMDIEMPLDPASAPTMDALPMPGDTGMEPEVATMQPGEVDGTPNGERTTEPGPGEAKAPEMPSGQMMPEGGEPAAEDELPPDPADEEMLDVPPDEMMPDPDGNPELGSEPERDPADEEPLEGRCTVQPLTAELRQAYDNLDPFYQKYADADGLLVVSSAEPADEALERGCLMVLDMTSARPDVREALIANYVRLAIIGENELTNDIPEFAYLPDSVNQRARGLGDVPTTSCAEESILCNTQLDGWRGEGICIHEFAHGLSIGGVYEADRSFQGRLQEAYENARDAGLFANTYAMENAQEYWAEGVQDWYYTNLESDTPNGIHNFVDRREELEEYDPALYALVAEVFPDEPQFVDCYSDE
jgi:hypothetical protein